MPQVFRPEQAEKYGDRAENLRTKVKAFAAQTSWVPIFGSLAQATSRESDAVMALLWGRGEQGETLELDERLKQGLLNHLKAQGNNYKAAVGVGLLFIPEAAIAKAVGSSIKGAKIIQGSAKLAQAVKYGEKAAKIGWEIRRAHQLSQDVNNVIEGLDEIHQHGLTQKAIVKLGSAGLGKLAERQKGISFKRGVYKFGENSLKGISQLPESNLKEVFDGIPDEQIAPDIQKFAKVLVTG